MNREEAIRTLKDMKVKIIIPKSAVTQNNKNQALDMAIEALGQEPCGDCVSREKVCDYIAEFVNNEYSTQSECEMMDAMIEGIQHLPSVNSQEPKTGWIPVSKRLTNDRREVLVTAYWHETYQVMMASYYGDGLWWCVPFNNCGDHMQKLNPKAWMPLPKPYKESEVEE